MSWGERSCNNYGACPIPNECSISTCNVDCIEYKSNGRTPDSFSEAKEIINPVKVISPFNHNSKIGKRKTCRRKKLK